MVHVHAKYWFGSYCGLIAMFFLLPLEAFSQEPSTDSGAAADLAPESGSVESEDDGHGALEVDTDEMPVVPPPRRKFQGKVNREKGVQGTKAHDRFEPETVNKSKYKLNGRALDVDPD
jgi:hypothetical protein